MFQHIKNFFSRKRFVKDDVESQIRIIAVVGEVTVRPEEEKEEEVAVTVPELCSSCCTGLESIARDIGSLTRAHTIKKRANIHEE
jgi:hypothetical protein